jgi:hypothetical protein
MAMLLRENAIQAHLVRWDDVRGRTITGEPSRSYAATSQANTTCRRKFGYAGYVGYAQMG